RLVPAQTAEITGSAWDPSSSVRLTLKSTTMESSLLEVTADSGGRFRVCFNVPDRDPGTYRVVACEHCGSDAQIVGQFALTFLPRNTPPIHSPGCPDLAAGASLALPVLGGPAPSSSPRPARPTPPPVQAVPPDARPLETVVNTEIAGIGRGYIAFNPSSVMRVGVSERIGVNLRKAFTQDLLDAVKRDLTSGLPGRGTPEFQQLDV